MPRTKLYKLGKETKDGLITPKNRDAIIFS